MNGEKRLYLSGQKIFGGVCSGIAEYFAIDPTIVRLIWAILIFYHGIGLISYIVAFFLIPLDPQKEDQNKADIILDLFWSFVRKIVAKTQVRSNYGQIDYVKILGFLLLLTGFIYLVIIIIPFIPWRILWPFVLMLIGILIINKSN